VCVHAIPPARDPGLGLEKVGMLTWRAGFEILIHGQYFALIMFNSQLLSIFCFTDVCTQITPVHDTEDFKTRKQHNLISIFIDLWIHNATFHCQRSVLMHHRRRYCFNIQLYLFPFNWFCRAHAVCIFVQFCCLSSMLWKRRVSILSWCLIRKTYDSWIVLPYFLKNQE
jgi:hypothetical protein